MEGDRDSQGRALLQCAVNAIQDGRWDDLTWLLQSHAPALHAARLRLEQQALDRHASRAAAAAAMETALVKEKPIVKEAAPQAPDPPVPLIVATEAHIADTGVADRVAVAPYRGLNLERTAALLCTSVDAFFRWADRAPWQALLVSQVLILASYAPAFGYSGFLMDDTVAIEKNPNVVGDAFSLHELLRRDFWGLPMHGAGWTNKSFRPLTTFTYRLNYLLHGLKSCGFHTSNVFLHCLASVALGGTARGMLGLPGSWAAAAAVFFGVHPVHTENVLYLVGRADILAALLGVAALNIYSRFFCHAPSLQGAPNADVVSDVEARRGWRAILPGWSYDLVALILPVMLIVASGLCKETGFTLFAVFLLMEILDILAASGRQQPMRVLCRTRIRVAALVLATVMVFIARYRHTSGTELNMSPQDNPISFEVSRTVRILSYAYIQGVYARLLCWPQFLCYDYSMDAIPAVRTARDCRLLLPLTAYVGLMVAVTLAMRAPLRYRRAGLLSLTLLIVPYLPASNVLFPVGTVVGERLLYIPSAGFCLVICVALHGALARWMSATGVAGDGNQFPSIDKAPCAGFATAPARARRGGRVASREPLRECAEVLGPQISSRRVLVSIVVALMAIAVLAVRTFLRVCVWESSETLFLHDGHTQQTSSKTQFNLGITHMQRQEWDQAVEALVRCAWADPLSSLPFYRIGQIEILRGRFQSAESFLSAAIDKFGASLMVRDEEVFHDLAVAMFQNGKADGAEKRLRIALRLNPDFAKGWNNLACCIAARDLQSATRAVRKAVSLEPGNPQYWANLALLARHTRDPATMSAAWQRASELYPGMPEPQDCTWEFAPAS